MCDCINTFNTCTFENLYEIEDELYKFQKMNMKLIFDFIE